MKLLSKEEQSEIAEAVKAAESKTSGEIATAIINESDNYAGYELSGAIFLSVITALLLALFSTPFMTFLETFFWEVSAKQLLLVSGGITLIVGIVSYFVLNFAAFNRLIIPKAELERRVHQRALVHFVESGVADTKDRTGILIFISIRERRVELIADRGINEEIAPGVWDEIVQTIITGIKEKKVKEGLVNAISRCGELLQEKFPIAEDDENELSNDIAILEK